jgi:AcrR family transcriptional regulator
VEERAQHKRNGQTARRTRGADSAERWDEIIRAAARIFYAKGYEATSLQDIASAVGMLKGSVYYYIETKEDLLVELVRRAQNLMEGTLFEDPAVAAAPAPERLRAFIGRWMALSSREREWATVAEREFGRLSRPRLHEVIARRDRFSTFVKGLIEQGVRDGAFDPDVDLSLATSAVFELMKTTHLWHRPGGPLSLHDVGDWYATFVIRGLGGPRWAEVHDVAAPPA